MWTWLASFLGGPVINGLISAYKAKLTAANTTEARAVELAAAEIQGEVAARQVEASIIRQEEGRWWTACIRPLFAMPFIVFAWKVIVWDKVLGWGTTDALDPNMWSVFITVIGAYFGGRTIEKVARIFKR
jgi:hypothetical protein